MVVFCTYYSIEAQAAQPAIFNRLSLLLLLLLLLSLSLSLSLSLLLLLLLGGSVEKMWFFSNGPNSTSECFNLLY
jgi:hypothetical protein